MKNTSFFQEADFSAFQLQGLYQRANLNTVLCALSELSKQPFYASLLTAEAVQEGLAHVMELTGLRGRWQTLRKQPTLICDAGHNAAGIAYVVRQLSQQPCQHLRIVFGMVNDKDYAVALAELEKLSDRATYYFTQPSCHRALPVETLAQAFLEKQLSVKTFPTVSAAVDAALTDADPKDCIFVGGSCYVVADLLESLDAMKG